MSRKGKSLKLSDDRYYLDARRYQEYMYNWFPAAVFGDDHLNNCLFVEMLTRVPEDFLTRNDKFGSYFGMEGRFPLLNLDYYMYIMSISSDIKMKNLDEM